MIAVSRVVIHGAFRQRRGCGGLRRRLRRDPGAQLVCGARARVHSRRRMAPSTRCRVRHGAASRRLPAGCSANKNAGLTASKRMPMPETIANSHACRFGGGAGAQRGRQCAPARRRDRGCAERPLELRAHLRQRRLGRRDRSRRSHALKAERPCLRQIKHAMSCGQSAAVRSGVAAARAPLIATLDGDGQNDPSFIPALLQAFEQGGRAVGLVGGPARRAPRRGSRNFSRASPTACAARSCATARATPAAA